MDLGHRGVAPSDGDAAGRDESGEQLAGALDVGVVNHQLQRADRLRNQPVDSDDVLVSEPGLDSRGIEGGPRHRCFADR